MIGIKRIKKSKTINRWILSYLMILLVPIIITGIFFIRKSINDAKIQFMANMVSKTNSTSQILDDSFYEIKKLCVQWSSSVLLSNVTGYVRNNTVEQNYKEYQNMLTEMRNYIISNDIITDIYIVLPSSDKVISIYAIETLDHFFGISLQFDDKAYDEVYTDVQRYTYFSIHPETAVEIYDKKETVIPVVQSFNYSISSIPDTLIVLLNPKYIENVVNSIFAPQEGYFRIISKADGRPLLIDEDPEVIEEAGFEYSLDSRISGWQYLYRVEKINSRINIRQIWGYSLLVGLASFVLGVIIAVYLVYRNYDPLNKLLNNASAQLSHKSGKKKSEYEIIEDSLNYLAETKMSFEKKMMLYEPVVRKELLTKIIKGYVGNKKEIYRIFNEMGLACGENSLFTVLIAERYEEKADPLAEYKQGTVQQKIQIMYLFEKVFDEFGYNVQVFESDYKRIAVITTFSREDESRYIDEIKGIWLKLRNILTDMNIELFVVFGDITGDVKDISTQYLKTEKTLERMIFTGDNSIEVKGDEKTFYFYPNEWELQLINFLKSGNHKSVKKMLTEIKSENLQKRSLQVNIYIRLICEVIETGMKVVEELGINHDFTGYSYTKIIATKSAASMWEQLETLFEMICDKVLENKSIWDQALKNKLVNYVDRNLTSSDISLNKVAEEFNLHPSTISIKFKQCTGYNFLDYINTNRINQAKKLLRETQDEIYYISELIGYINYSSFSRIFSKYEGISPVKYRNIHSPQTEN